MFLRYTATVFFLFGLLAAPGLYAQDYVISNAHLITMVEAEPVAGEILVVDGRIAQVAREVRRGSGVTVIDGGGGFVIPGLAEMHAHVPQPAQGEAYRDDVLQLWALYGVSTARSMLGHPEHLQLQRAIIDENRLAPRLVTSGPSFNGNSVSNPAQAGTMVAEQAVLGYDFLKIHPGLSRAEYDAMAEAAHERNIDFAGHVPSQVGLAHALNRGQLTIDHLDGLLQALIPDLENEVGSDEGFFGVNLVHRVDARRIPELVDMIKQSGAWMVPTETLFENFAAAASPAELLARPEIVYLPPDLMSGYERALAGAATATDDMSRYLALRKQLLRAMHTAGVGLLLGSDSPQVFNVPGYSIHRELQSMVAAGLPPLAALRMGTTNPALFLGRAEDFGALVAGQSADLVILGSNPLESISNSLDIRGVMLRGRWVDAEERAARLADIAKRYATAE